MVNSNELQHWGIKGMRWGVRRYQNKDGSLTPAGRKRYDDDDDVGSKSGAGTSGSANASANSTRKSASDMTDEELDAAIRRARKEKEYEDLTRSKNSSDNRSNAEDPNAARKARILESDSAKNVYENRDLFTTQELQDAYRRLNTEKLIQDLVPKEVSAGEKFINKVAKVGTAAGTIFTAVNNAQKLTGFFNNKNNSGGNDNENAGKKKNKNKAKDKSSDKSKDENDKPKDDKSSADAVKETKAKIKEVFSGGDKNPVTDVVKGVTSKYASMNTSSIEPKYPVGKSVSAYASYGKDSPSIKKSTSGVLSKYSSMDTASIDASSTSAGASFVKNILDDFDYKLTDKK